MKQALIDLLSSKKAIVAVVTAITAIGLELGYDINETKLAMVFGLGASLITAFGLQDHGKAAALVHANSIAAEPSPMPSGDDETEEPAS